MYWGSGNVTGLSENVERWGDVYGTDRKRRIQERVAVKLKKRRMV